METTAVTTHSSSKPTIAASAPVVSSAEGTIDAPIDVVWRILIAIEQWPTWNHDVKSVSMDGPTVEGATFRWKAGSATITSTLTHLARPNLVAWTGRTLGIRAIHIWRLEQRGDRTHVRTEESYEGIVARLFRRPLQKTLDATLSKGLRHLETEAERVVSTDP